MKENIIICNKRVFLREEFILLCLEHKTQQKLADHLGCSRAPVRTALKKYFPDLRKGGSLGVAILELEGKAQCSVCKEIKCIENNFYKSASKPRGIESSCIQCEKKRYEKDKDWKNKQKREHYYVGNKDYFSEKARFYKLKKEYRTPVWADRESIKKFYLNCPEGYQVDHVIPLNGKYVSGLHVIENLQYLTIEENLKKSNKFDIEGQ